MIKKHSITRLIYREFYLSKDQYMIVLLISAISILMGLLAIISFRFGNLNSLFQEGSKTAIPFFPSETIPRLRRTTVLLIRYLPVLSISMGIFYTYELASKDTLKTWRRFLRTTPLTPSRCALSKCITTMAVTLGSFLLSLAYLLSASFLLGETVTVDDLIYVSSLIVCFVIWSVLSQLLIHLFQNTDRGMLASLFSFAGLLFLLLWPRFVRMLQQEEERILMEIQKASLSGEEVIITESASSPLTFLADTAISFGPYLPIILLISFIILFLGHSYLYKRREK